MSLGIFNHLNSSLLAYLIIALIFLVVIYFYWKSKSNASYKSSSSSDIRFTFSVKDLNKSEVANLKENRSVRFWQKPNTNTVFIYRSGTMGGRGRIGVVPKQYSKQIIKDLKNNRTYVGEIASISPANVTIRYTRPSSQRMKKIQRNYTKKRSNQLEQLLNKNYNPQKGFHISVNFAKNKSFDIGDTLNIKFKEKEHYIKNPQSLELDFYNSKNEKVGTKKNQPDKIRRILRAYFNNYKIITEISSIRELDKHTLKYYKHIPGAAQVDFKKMPNKAH